MKPCYGCDSFNKEECATNCPDAMSRRAKDERYSCPACSGAMEADHMGLPLQEAHRNH